MSEKRRFSVLNPQAYREDIDERKPSLFYPPSANKTSLVLQQRTTGAARGSR